MQHGTLSGLRNVAELAKVVAPLAGRALSAADFNHPEVRNRSTCPGL